MRPLRRVRQAGRTRPGPRGARDSPLLRRQPVPRADGRGRAQGGGTSGSDQRGSSPDREARAGTARHGPDREVGVGSLMAADIDEARARLREWAHFFRDVARRSRSFSAEGAWRSPQVWEAQKPKPAYDPKRALTTWLLLREVDTPPGPQGKCPYYRALTWRYCYPWLPVGIPLRSLSRRLGYKINLRTYDELVYVGEIRLSRLLDT